MISVEIREKDLQAIMTEISIEKLEDEDKQENLISALNTLKPEHSELIDLRFFMRYSFKEIAEFYNITEANAKMRVYRILDRLKKAWNSK